MVARASRCAHAARVVRVSVGAVAGAIRLVLEAALAQGIQEALAVGDAITASDVDRGGCLCTGSCGRGLQAVESEMSWRKNWWRVRKSGRKKGQKQERRSGKVPKRSKEEEKKKKRRKKTTEERRKKKEERRKRKKERKKKENRRRKKSDQQMLEDRRFSEKPAES